VDPGAELERVADGMPRLDKLTLPGEWAFGWAAAPFSPSSFLPRPPPIPTATSLGTRRRPSRSGWEEPTPAELAATPLGRLLLRSAGRGAMLDIRVVLPAADQYGDPRKKAVPDCRGAADQRIHRICMAAGREAAARAKASGEGGVPKGAEGGVIKGAEGGAPKGAELPPVKCRAYRGDRTYYKWAGWPQFNPW
jgi:hypothetical protein